MDLRKKEHSPFIHRFLTCPDRISWMNLAYPSLILMFGGVDTLKFSITPK
jgi:hypothetical protein